MSVASYLRESVDELRKVRWPTRATTVQYSVIVVASVIVLATLIGLLDYGLSQLVTFLLERS